jgi:hypothetical protein
MGFETAVTQYICVKSVAESRNLIEDNKLYESCKQSASIWVGAIMARIAPMGLAEGQASRSLSR